MSWKASISWLPTTKVKSKNHKPHIKGEWETNKENVNMKGRKEKSRERKRLGKKGRSERSTKGK